MDTSGVKPLRAIFTHETPLEMRADHCDVVPTAQKSLKTANPLQKKIIIFLPYLSLLVKSIQSIPTL